MRFNPFIRITLPLIIWALLMFSASSIPGKNMPEIPIWNWDKLAHTFEYFILATLCFRYIYLRRKKNLIASFKITLIFCCLYGISDELHQLFIPNRFCSWIDLTADISGVITGAIFTLVYFRIREKSGTYKN